MMNHPLWMLVPWLVLALAAGFKFWRITSLFRRQLLGPPSSSASVRRSLERIWAKSP